LIGNRYRSLLSEEVVFGLEAGLLMAVLRAFDILAQPRGKWRIDAQAFERTGPGEASFRIRWDQVEAVRLLDRRLRTAKGCYALSLPAYGGAETRAARRFVFEKLMDLSGLRSQSRLRGRWAGIPWRNASIVAAWGVPYQIYLYWLCGRLAARSTPVHGGVAVLLIICPLLAAPLLAIPFEWRRLFWRKAEFKLVPFR
jgi:hypothetical protein